MKAENIYWRTLRPVPHWCCWALLTWGAAVAGEPSNADSERPPASTTKLLERGQHHQVWEHRRYYRTPEGEWRPRTFSYVELGSGLNRRDSVSGQWVAARAAFEIAADGSARCSGSAYQVVLAPDLNIRGAVLVRTPDGREISSAPMGLAVVDRVTGRNELLAEIQSCQPEQISPTEVVYRDAFQGVQADLRFRISLGAFEADVILREAPLLPDGYTPETTQLEVLTEFFSAPEPTTRRLGPPATTEPAMAGAPLVSRQDLPVADEEVDFGGMHFGAGQAFRVEAEAGAPGIRLPVGKSWEQLDGRQFLIESVQWQALQALLSGLPKARQASVGGPRDRATVSAPRHRQLPPVHQDGLSGMKRGSAVGMMTGREGRPGRLIASHGPDATARPGVLIDYVLAVSQTNFTFRADTTYYVSGTVNLSGTTTFEGGTVIKYASSGTPTLNVATAAPVVFNTDFHRPVIFTAKDDDSVGDIIAGSSGDPTGAYYANPALSLNGYGMYSGYNLANLRISHARLGVSISYFTGYAGYGHVLSHAQFIRSAFGAKVTSGDLSLRNVLFWQVGTNFYNWTSSTGRGEHITSHETGALIANSSSSTYYLTNSLLVNVTNASGYAGAWVSNVVDTGAQFNNVGAGFHYLLDDTFRNKGTNTINASLLSDLKKLTTYAPLETAPTAPTAVQAARDTDQPDLGYHYAPIDYMFDSWLVPADIQVTAGVVLGLSGAGSITVRPVGSSIRLTCQGTPVALNRLTRTHLVQEGYWVASVADNTLALVSTESTTYGGWPALDFRFTSLSTPAGSGALLNVDPNTADLILSDCELYGAAVNDLGSGSIARTNTLRNTHFERVALNLGDGLSTTAVTVLAWNNLFRLSSLSLNPAMNNQWAWHDNLFDSSTMTQSAGGLYNGYNAYYSSTRLQPLANTDQVLGSLTYSTGALGRYYQPSNSSLIDAGSTTADVAGFYHYTVLTAQTKEAATRLDIGRHYAALNAQGAPVDSDSNGVPDYLQDPTGSAALNTAALAGGNGPTQGFKVVITRPPNGSNLP